MVYQFYYTYNYQKGCQHYNFFIQPHHLNSSTTSIRFYSYKEIAYIPRYYTTQYVYCIPIFHHHFSPEKFSNFVKLVDATFFSVYFISYKTRRSSYVFGR